MVSDGAFCVGFFSQNEERKYPPRLAFEIAALLSLICLLPTPAYLQYFSLCVPFLVFERRGVHIAKDRAAWTLGRSDRSAAS